MWKLQFNSSSFFFIFFSLFFSFFVQRNLSNSKTMQHMGMTHTLNDCTTIRDFLFSVRAASQWLSHIPFCALLHILLEKMPTFRMTSLLSETSIFWVRPASRVLYCDFVSWLFWYAELFPVSCSYMYKLILDLVLEVGNALSANSLRSSTYSAHPSERFSRQA